MSDEQQTPGQVAEAAAIRRRWITLGEILAVAAVLISGLTLWNSYQERQDAAADRAASKQDAKAEAQTLLLRGTPDKGGKRLTLAPLDPNQAIQSQTIAFPAALGIDPVDTVIEPRIEAGWFDNELLKARKAAGAAKAGAGDERMPVMIRTRFFSDRATHDDVAIYDLGYRVDEGGILSGSEIELRGLSRIERAKASGAQARLDRIWQSRQPTISAGEKK